MKAHLGMTGSGFSRSAITRSTLCLSIATALALPVAIPAITPSTAVEQTAEKRDSAFYNGTTSERAAASCWEAKQANPEAKERRILAVHSRDEPAYPVLLRSGN